jgi:hypothetical protein
MIGWHRGASTLLRHVVAALPFSCSQCRTPKDTSHGWRDRPQKGNRQQRKCSRPSHPHDCTASAVFEKQSTTSNSDVSPPLTTTAATVITTLELKEASHLTRFMKSTELFGEPSFQTKHLDPGVRSRVDTSHGAKQRSGFRDSGQSGRSESTRFDTMKRSVFSQERRADHSAPGLLELQDLHRLPHRGRSPPFTKLRIQCKWCRVSNSTIP